MTNGEKIQSILDVDRDCTEVHGENGTMTFTVTQDFWNAEYKEPTTKNDLAVDCISRQEVLRLLANSIGKTNTYLQTKVLRMPSVTPQEPFINKPCVSSGVCEQDKQKVLDKIRAEIEQLTFEYDKGIGIDDTRTDAEKSSDWWKMEKLIVLQIIDKYKAESEET